MGRSIFAAVCGITVLAGAIGSTVAGAADPTVPGAPTITSVKAGEFSITIAFKKPTNTGGAAITGYRTQCTSSNGGKSGAQSPLDSPSRVPGLSANKTYRCTVTARNNVGAGPASAPSSAVVVLPKVPSAPKVTAAKAVGLRSITVAFSKSTHNGHAPITNYRATCASSNGGGKRTRLAPHSPISVNGLTADKTYRCTVAAANRMGTGASSAPSGPVVAFPTVPGAPKITSVKAVGLLSVSITVTDPANTGGGKISSYRAVCTSSNGGIQRARVASDSPVKVSGLTAGKTYTCTVAAANTVRRGPPSAPSKPVVPRAH